MSIFIGSFVGKVGSTLPGIYTTVATTTVSCIFSTESYILALTNAPQTEIDTLNAGEIILKQFQANHLHISQLHKRTDNARNFSSHGTAEAEKLICQRVSVSIQ